MNRRNFEYRAMKELKENGYAITRATLKPVKIGKKWLSAQNDFFFSFDLIAVKDNEVRFIQVTSGTRSSLSKHKKKIERNFSFSFPSIVSVELWFFYKLSGRWLKKIYFFKNGEWIPENVSYEKRE
ncbi:MAG: hypothetical protein ACP5L4_01975 [Thermoplasmata archaeon]